MTKPQKHKQKVDPAASLPQPEADELPAYCSTENRHVVDSINSYCKFPYPQQYALMIRGKWGSGKTFLTNRTLRDAFPPRTSGDPNQPIYITLFGARDAADVGDLLYQALHPILSSKGMRIAGAVMKGLLKTTVRIDLSEFGKGDLTLGSQLPDIKASELLNGATGRVLVFDDIERAKMTASEILAFVNPIVEHDDCKVILIANEDEINTEKRPDHLYGEWREKTIGQTVEVKADVDGAFSGFLGSIDSDWAKQFYQDHAVLIKSVLKASACSNLRLLRQFLWDFERFSGALTDEQRSHEQGMSELLALILALTIEIRSNNISVNDICLDGFSVSMRVLNQAGDAKALAQKEMFRRYEEHVNFSSRLLSQDTILRMIDVSVYNKKEIQDQLNAHPYFAKPDQIPSWRMLWLSGELDLADVPTIITRFERDFQTRKFTSEPEILHIIGLGLWLAEVKQPGWNDVETMLKSYIDDVLSKRPAQIADLPVTRDISIGFGGAFGLGFHNTGDSRFPALAKYLRDRLAIWKEAGYPRAGAYLLELLQQDSDAFLRAVCNTAEGAGQLAQVPVLCSIDIDDFVSAFVKLSWPNRKNVYLALQIRYDFLHPNSPLWEERDWISGIYKSLLYYASTLPPIPQWSWKVQIKAFMGKLAGEDSKP